MFLTLVLIVCNGIKHLLSSEPTSICIKAIITFSIDEPTQKMLKNWRCSFHERAHEAEPYLLILSHPLLCRHPPPVHKTPSSADTACCQSQLRRGKSTKIQFVTIESFLQHDSLRSTSVEGASGGRVCDKSSIDSAHPYAFNRLTCCQRIQPQLAGRKIDHRKNTIRGCDRDRKELVISPGHGWEL